MEINTDKMDFSEVMELLIGEYSELEIAEYFGPRVLFNALINTLNKSIESLEGLKDPADIYQQKKLVYIRDRLVAIYNSKVEYL